MMLGEYDVLVIVAMANEMFAASISCPPSKPQAA
jgi:hypothetical protein